MRVHNWAIGGYPESLTNISLRAQKRTTLHNKSHNVTEWKSHIQAVFAPIKHNKVSRYKKTLKKIVYIRGSSAWAPIARCKYIGLGISKYKSQVIRSLLSKSYDSQLRSDRWFVKRCLPVDMLLETASSQLSVPSSSSSMIVIMLPCLRHHSFYFAIAVY